MHGLKLMPRITRGHHALPVSSDYSMPWMFLSFIGKSHCAVKLTGPEICALVLEEGSQGGRESWVG